jgi:hypothetical protein
VTKKGFGVWLFSTLTVIAAIHLIDAANALLFDKPITLLRLYPLEEAKLQAITPTIYFLTTAASTLILWGITCAIAFENPVEAFLNKILSDAKKQSAVETQLLEEKSEILDAINETVEMNNEILAHIRDLMYKRESGDKRDSTAWRRVGENTGRGKLFKEGDKKTGGKNAFSSCVSKLRKNSAFRF